MTLLITILSEVSPWGAAPLLTSRQAFPSGTSHLTSVILFRLILTCRSLFVFLVIE